MSDDTDLVPGIGGDVHLANAEHSLGAPATAESFLNAMFGNVDDRRKATATLFAIKKAVRAERMRELPEVWPMVGTLRGAVRWAAVDTETTGLDPRCRCVEVAVVIVDGGQVTEEWTTRINPGPAVIWEEEAMKCHRICPDDVVTAPTPFEVWTKFVEMTAGIPLAAHNSQFDRKIIAAELALVGLPPHQNIWYCTMGPRRQRLESLYYTYTRRKIDGAHSALADARAVAYLTPRVCR